MSKITIAADNRTLLRGDKPFFWLADTCWSAFTNMSGSEWENYIDLRTRQGFNIVQVNALPQWDRCGDAQKLYPFPTEDGFTFHYDGTIREEYFARAGKMARYAAERGIALAVVVQWCNYVPGTWASAKHGENVLPEEMVEPVVRKICTTFQPYDPVFLISGDTDFNTPQAQKRYQKVAALVHRYAPDLPTAYHISGWNDRLPESFGKDADIYLYQSGHNPAFQHTAHTLAESFYKRTPEKPVINSEPCYEEMGYSRMAYGRHRRENTRWALWSSLLSGACAGITYGAHGVWNWYKPDMPFNPVGGEGFLQAQPCTVAVGLPGAEDYAFARRLLESWQSWNLMPCQEILAAYWDDVRAAFCKDRVVIYLPTAAPLTLVGDWTGYEAEFVDLETQKSLTAYGSVQGGQTRFEQAICYRDALLILKKA